MFSIISRKPADSHRATPPALEDYMTAPTLETLRRPGSGGPSMTPEETAQWAAKVRALAEKRNAVILAHNYQVPEIQDVAHHVGDSLALSRIADMVGDVLDLGHLV